MRNILITGSWTEGFGNKKPKTTNAIDDTSDVIRNNLKSERRYAKKNGQY